MVGVFKDGELPVILQYLVILDSPTVELILAHTSAHLQAKRYLATMADNNNSNNNPEQPQSTSQPGLIGSHYQYVKGAAEVSVAQHPLRIRYRTHSDLPLLSSRPPSAF